MSDGDLLADESAEPRPPRPPWWGRPPSPPVAGRAWESELLELRPPVAGIELRPPVAGLAPAARCWPVVAACAACGWPRA